MNRVSLTLLVLIACLSARGQDNPAGGTARDNSGFLPVSNNTPTMASGATDQPLTPIPSASAMIAAPPVIATQPDGSAPPMPPPVSTEDTNFVTSSLVAQTSAYNLDDSHKLAPGDQISFQIVEDRTNALPMIVTESSELDIPYIGRQNVADKTCKQLAGDIKALLEKDYYYKATVIIGLDTLSKLAGKVYVMGPVNHPGPVEIPANENFSVSKAILEAGGFADFANKNKVQVVRKTALGTQTINVNVGEVIKGHIEQDVAVTNGDLIIVPQRAVNFGQ